MKKHHKFSHTTMEHHKDGSITMHHKHESDPDKDVKHAVADLDGAHESMESNLGAPNPGEGQMAAPPAAAAPPAPAPPMGGGM